MRPPFDRSKLYCPPPPFKPPSQPLDAVARNDPQLLASHNAESYRRAIITEQTFEGRKENLNEANKLPRTHATLLEVLNRHRGKGQQKVDRSNTSNVHQGGHHAMWRGSDTDQIGESTPPSSACASPDACLCGQD